MAKYFDIKRATVFGLGHRLSKALSSLTAALLICLLVKVLCSMVGG